MPALPALPDAVVAMATRGDDWAAWVRALPRLLGELIDDWSLVPAGGAWSGHTAVVLPVRRDDGSAAALKVGFPHPESEHEHLALRRWAGVGAVRLLRADPGRGALLLERLGLRDLGEEWDVAACEVVGDLYGRLHVPALPQLRTLADHLAPGLDRLAALPREAPLPHRLVEQARSAARDLGASRAGAGEAGLDARTLHTDLHYANVLAADREPWLAIDPKPLAGDPAYEIAPLLWNRWEELAGDVRGGLRRRFHAVVDAAGLDEHRARDWVVVRMLVMAAWGLTSPEVPAAERTDLLTTCVTIAKAVQD